MADNGNDLTQQDRHTFSLLAIAELGAEDGAHIDSTAAWAGVVPLAAQMERELINAQPLLFDSVRLEQPVSRAAYEQWRADHPEEVRSFDDWDAMQSEGRSPIFEGEDGQYAGASHDPDTVATAMTPFGYADTSVGLVDLTSDFDAYFLDLYNAPLSSHQDLEDAYTDPTLGDHIGATDPSQIALDHDDPEAPSPAPACVDPIVQDQACQASPLGGEIVTTSMPSARTKAAMSKFTKAEAMAPMSNRQGDKPMDLLNLAVLLGLNYKIPDPKIYGTHNIETELLALFRKQLGKGKWELHQQLSKWLLPDALDDLWHTLSHEEHERQYILHVRDRSLPFNHARSLGASQPLLPLAPKPVSPMAGRLAPESPGTPSIDSQNTVASALAKSMLAAAQNTHVVPSVGAVGQGIGHGLTIPAVKDKQGIPSSNLKENAALPGGQTSSALARSQVPSTLARSSLVTCAAAQNKQVVSGLSALHQGNGHGLIQLAAKDKQGINTEHAPPLAPSTTPRKYLVNDKSLGVIGDALNGQARVVDKQSKGPAKGTKRRNDDNDDADTAPLAKKLRNLEPATAIAAQTPGNVGRGSNGQQVQVSQGLSGIQPGSRAVVLLSGQVVTHVLYCRNCRAVGAAGDDWQPGMAVLKGVRTVEHGYRFFCLQCFHRIFLA